MYSKLVNKVPVFVRVTDENRHGKAPKALYLLEALVFTKLPNARPELRPEVGATEERTLLAVSSSPMFGEQDMGDSRHASVPQGPLA